MQLSLLMSMMFGKGGSSSGGGWSGATEAISSLFKGFSKLTVSSISIPSIDKWSATGEAPFNLRVSATSIIASGTRNSGKPINPINDLEHTWLVTKADGSPVLYNNELIDPDTGSSFNPYTDTFGPEGAFLLREPGDYTLTLTTRGSLNDGTVGVVTYSETITVLKETSSHMWFDPVNGLDTNDGLDALGLSLTNASYVDATGVLSETGKFTGLVLDNLYPQNSKDWIYINGHGLLRIVEYIDADSCRIHPEYKLGADFTGLTSSNGAQKTTFNGTETSSARNAKIYHILGGQTYVIDNPITYGTWGSSPNKAPMGVTAYGGSKATIHNSGVNTQGIMYNQLGASADSAYQFYIDSLIIDGQDTYKVGNGAEGSSKTIQHSTLFINSDFINSSESICFSQQVYVQNIDLDFLMWGVFIENLTKTKVNYTLADPALSTSSTIVVNEVIGGLTTPKGSFTIEGVVYRYTSYTGSTFTLDTGSKAFSPSNYTINTPCFSGEEKGLSILTRANTRASWEAHIGCSWTNDSAHSSRDHYGYLNGGGGHLLVYNQHCYGSNNANMSLNINNEIHGGIRDSVSIIYGKFSECSYGFDCSGTLNPYDDELFESMYIYGSKVNPKIQVLGYTSCKSVFAKAVDTVLTAALNNSSAFSQEGWGTGVYDGNIFELKLENCRVSGGGALQGTLGGTLEAYNVDMVHSGTGSGSYGDYEVRTDNLAPNSVIVIDGCDMYAPNNPNSLRLNGVTVDLATFNAAVGGTNTQNDPGWTDFPPAAIPNLTGTFDIPDGGIGDVINLDVSGINSGGVATSWAFTGTPPTGLSIDNSGVITGTSTGGTWSGYAVTATNASGSSTSNTDTVTYASTAQVLTFNGVDSWANITPITGLTIGDTITIDFQITGNDQYLFSGGLSSGGHNLYLFFKYNNLYFIGGTMTIDGTAVTNGSNAGAFKDGLWHTAIWTCTDTNGRDITAVGRNEENNANNEYYSGTARNLSVVKASVETKYNIDSGSITTEDASVGSGTMTFNNVVEGDWA